MATKKVFSVSEALDEIEFEITGDDFKAYAPDKLPANVLIKYSELVQAGKIYEAHEQFFSRALHPESALLFNHRLESHENPINLGIMVQVAEWLVDQYSNFPTQARKR